MFQTLPDGRVEWLNETAARIVGFESAEEFIAAVGDIRDIYVDPKRRDAFRTEIERDGSVTDFAYEIERPDGSRRWISVSARTVMRPDGSIESYEGAVHDVTDRKLLEAATHAMTSQLDPLAAVTRFADVLARVIPFKQLTLAVIEGDHYRRVVSITPGGVPGPFKLGESVPLKGNSMQTVAATAKPLVVQDTTDSDYDYDKFLKSNGVLSYAIFPLRDDVGAFATFNIGMGLRDAFDDEVMALLEQHTAAVAQAVKNILLFEQQRELLIHLEELDRLKNEFFASVSHDLRHPVAVIEGLSELMNKSWATLPEEQKIQMISMMASNAKLLGELLQQDLDVALLQSGQLSYEIAPFDLGTQVAETVNALAPIQGDHEFEMHIGSELPPAMGDKRRNSQVLQNLLSNAVKFSPPGTKIRVAVALSGDQLEVSVADEGPGFTDKQGERLFQRFSRLEGEQPGTGLGLYIARSMVEAQGGRIWAESTPGQGSMFRFTVPVA